VTVSHRGLFLALDLGTSGVKAGVVDTKGQLIATSSERYPTTTPQPGWVEQDPETWWGACGQALREVTRHIDPAQLRGMSVAGLAPALVCLNERGQPVRPAPIWSDHRAAAEVTELNERLGYDTNFSLLPRLLWVKRYEPTNYHQTRSVLHSYEYVGYKLTGQVASIAATEQLSPWAEQDFGASGLDREKFPPRVCKLGELLGPVCRQAAEETGLRSGLPVVAGTVDAFAAWIGTATTEKGVLCNTVGTSDGIALVWDQPLRDPQGRLDLMPHVTGRDWIIGGALSSGGITLDWFARRFYDHVPNPYDRITVESSSIPVGAEGLIALPYLVGERSPMNDPHARGVFFGLAETHTRAHLARAVLESVAFAVRDVCQALVEVGAEIKQIRVAGGGAQSDVWNQIKADVVGRPVLVPQVADSGLLGAAIIAGWGVGEFSDLSSAAHAMVKFRTAFEPNPEHHAMYTQLFELYRELYKHLKADFARLSELSRELLRTSSRSS
jgi:xylulokinase